MPSSLDISINALAEMCQVVRSRRGNVRKRTFFKYKRTFPREDICELGNSPGKRCEHRESDLASRAVIPPFKRHGRTKYVVRQTNHWRTDLAANHQAPPQQDLYCHRTRMVLYLDSLVCPLAKVRRHSVCSVPQKNHLPFPSAHPTLPIMSVEDEIRTNAGATRNVATVDKWDLQI